MGHGALAALERNPGTTEKQSITLPGTITEVQRNKYLPPLSLIELECIWTMVQARCPSSDCQVVYGPTSTPSTAHSLNPSTLHSCCFQEGFSVVQPFCVSCRKESCFCMWTKNWVFSPSDAGGVTKWVRPHTVCPLYSFYFFPYLFVLVGIIASTYYTRVDIFTAIQEHYILFVCSLIGLLKHFYFVYSMN